MKSYFCILLLASLLPAQAMALPFGDFDARSAGMGSVGVATSSLAAAAFYNPAMLNHQEESSDFEFLGVAGIRGTDSDDLLDDIDDFNTAFNAGRFGDATDIFTRSLDKTVAISAHAGAAIGINAESFNLALIAQRYIHAAMQPTGTDYTNAKLNAIGIDITEIGLATSFAIGDFSIGLTPKSQSVKSYDYSPDIIGLDTDYQDIFDEQGEIDHDTNFNLDLGVIYKLSDATFAGLTVRNVAKQEYTTRFGRLIEMEPQGRIGIGYRGDFLRIGIDVDITENKPVAFEDKSQYAAVGLELNAWDWLQLRLGYRDNIASGAKSEQLYTAGVGIRLFGSVGLDAAVQANDTSDANEVAGFGTLVVTF